jgi:peptidoglycan/LPS O-acetylase OafA/YrhL
VKRPGRWWLLLVPIALFFGQTPLHYLSGALQPGGPAWGCSPCGSRGRGSFCCPSRYVPKIFVSVAALIFATAVYSALLKPDHEYDILTYPALVVMLGALIAVSQRTKMIRRNAILNAAADCSFTLYLIHHTIIVAIVTIPPRCRRLGMASDCACRHQCRSIADRPAHRSASQGFAAWIYAVARRGR